jgi:hypothetical protein
MIDLFFRSSARAALFREQSGNVVLKQQPPLFELFEGLVGGRLVFGFDPPDLPVDVIVSGGEVAELIIRSGQSLDQLCLTGKLFGQFVRDMHIVVVNNSFSIHFQGRRYRAFDRNAASMYFTAPSSVKSLG